MSYLFNARCCSVARDLDMGSDIAGLDVEVDVGLHPHEDDQASDGYYIKMLVWFI